MKRISSEFQHADAEIDEAAHKVRYIDTAQLGLWSQAGRNLIDAVPEFKQVSSFKTTSGKIDCLLRSIKILTAPIICEKEGSFSFFLTFLIGN
jgi:hypothetical protein